MAAHPDDPPLETVRQQPRLVHRPELYQRLLDLSPSHADALEFCVGAIAEMATGDVRAAVARYAAQGRIAYVHLRNMPGRVPHYRETFTDVQEFRRLVEVGIGEQEIMDALRRRDRVAYAHRMRRHLEFGARLIAGQIEQ